MNDEDKLRFLQCLKYNIESNFKFGNNEAVNEKNLSNIIKKYIESVWKNYKLTKYEALIDSKGLNLITIDLDLYKIDESITIKFKIDRE